MKIDSLFNTYQYFMFGGETDSLQNIFLLYIHIVIFYQGIEEVKGRNLN